VQFSVTIVTENCSGSECSAESTAGERAGGILENDKLRGGDSHIRDVNKKHRRTISRQTAQATHTRIKARTSGSAPLVSYVGSSIIQASVGAGA